MTPGLQCGLAVANETGRRHHAAGLEEAREALRPSRVTERVVVHDDTATGGRDQAGQICDAAVDRRGAQFMFHVRWWSGQVDERRSLTDEIRSCHRREGSLHV